LRLIPTQVFAEIWEREALRIVTGDAHGNRTARFASAIFASLLAGTLLQPCRTARRVPPTIAFRTKGETPPGGHWHYRNRSRNNANAGI